MIFPFSQFGIYSNDFFLWIEGRIYNYIFKIFMHYYSFYILVFFFSFIVLIFYSNLKFKFILLKDI
jgi:hypothetical protein